MDPSSSSSMSEASILKLQAITKELFTECMKGNWNRVIDLYSNNPFVRVAKITRAEDTVLHLAISEATPDVVQRLVDLLPNDKIDNGKKEMPDTPLHVALPDEAGDTPLPVALPNILALPNEAGDTPLHVAAALGLVDVCSLLVKKCPELVVEARNAAGETPLFVAALHGKKKAFFVMQDAILSKKLEGDVVSYCRRSGGDTILHAAVYGEYFGMFCNSTYFKPCSTTYFMA